MADKPVDLVDKIPAPHPAAKAVKVAIKVMTTIGRWAKRTQRSMEREIER